MRLDGTQNRGKQTKTAKSVASQVRVLALEKGPHFKLPTTRELCNTFSTTKATLNDALADLEAHNVIFRKDRSGIYVSPKIHHKSIAVVFSLRANERFIGSPFWGMLLDLLFHSAVERTQVMEHEYSFHLLPFDVSREESVSRRNFEDQLQSGSLDGVMTVQPDNALVESLIRTGVPVVGYALGPECGWGVGYDPTELFRLSVEQLARQGCRRISVISTYEPPEPYYSQIVAQCQDADPVVTFSLHISRTNLNDNDRNSQDVGWRLMQEIFGDAQSLKPDGLIFTDDMLADGAIKALFEMGILPGRDVKIATLANTGSPILRRLEKRLILIESDAALIVDKMFDTLDSVLGPDPPSREYIHIPWRVRVYGDIVAS